MKIRGILVIVTAATPCHGLRNRGAVGGGNSQAGAADRKGELAAAHPMWARGPQAFFLASPGHPS
jgi:hypothetical protein